jgi:hypothetical protein
MSLDFWLTSSNKQYQQALKQRSKSFDSLLLSFEGCGYCRYFFSLEHSICNHATLGIERRSQAPHSHASTT